MTEPIRRALISVSDKTGLADLGAFLADQGVEILSTGGSAKLLADAGVPVVEVSDFTGFPEIMDGRVKTLQPMIHGGLLAVRANAEHQKAMADHGIQPIDLLVVNLYPFEATVAKGAEFDDCIENIDIGGPALIRGGISIVQLPPGFCDDLWGNWGPGASLAERRFPWTRWTSQIKLILS